MRDRTPVTTLEELDALDSDEIVAGYFAGRDGDAEPGDNRSKAYWHGWRNGRADSTGDIDDAQRLLVKRVVARSRAEALGPQVSRPFREEP